MTKVNSNTNITATPEGVYIFQSFGASTTESIELISVNWEADPQYIAGKKIIPYGTNNNLPLEMRELMENNNLASGILKREKGLLWGYGPQLFEESFDNNKIKRIWMQDQAIQNFLDDINYETLIDTLITEYKHLAGYFIKFFRNKGSRIGANGFITDLQFVTSKNARLEWVDSRRLDDVKHIFVGDWENDCRTTGVQTYKRFNKKEPFAQAVSIDYVNSYSLCRDMYSIPDFWGSRHWIKRSSDIPVLLKSLTDNSMAPTYHISVPQEYWAAKEDALRQKCTLSNTQYNPKMLETLQKETFTKVSEVMSGKKNAGKFITSVEFMDERGNRVKWEVKPIEYKAKEFIEAQIKIGEMADAATMSGISVHPTLANTAQNGKSLSSGSENLYAYKIYLASDTYIPERMIMKSINDAIKINFPKSKLKLGFYHDVSATSKEEDTTPKNRLTNQQN